MDRSLGSPRARWKLPPKQPTNVPVEVVKLTPSKAFLDDSLDDSLKRVDQPKEGKRNVRAEQIDIV